MLAVLSVTSPNRVVGINLTKLSKFVSSKNPGDMLTHTALRGHVKETS